jgi:hypothetical protein
MVGLAGLMYKDMHLMLGYGTTEKKSTSPPAFCGVVE